jgi:parvulin-like peptidyl-prolyl isomerase
MKNDANFDKDMTQYNEDTGTASNPNCYIVGPNSNFVKAFENESLRLKVGEIGGVQSDYGYHIIKRFALTEENFTSEKDSVLDKMRQTKLEAELDARAKTAKVVKEEELLAKVDAALFTISYAQSDGTTSGAAAGTSSGSAAGTNP